MFIITDKPIDLQKHIEQLLHSSIGAIVTFEGHVRDQHKGLAVQSLNYECYEELAIQEGQKILQEANSKFQISASSVIHRVGHLQISDCAISIVVSAPHRKDAFVACSYIIDRIKESVPIWKHEHYQDGSSLWVYPST